MLSRTPGAALVVLSTSLTLFTVGHSAGARATAPQDASLPIEVGSVVRGRLDASDQRLTDGQHADSYVFQGRSGQQLIIRLEGAPLDAFLWLTDPRGRHVAVNDDSGGSLDALISGASLAMDGPYTVRVSSHDPGETGGYRLSIEEPSPVAAQPLAVGARVVGHLGGGATMSSGRPIVPYSFQARAGHVLELRLTTDDLDAEFWLVDPAGRVLSISPKATSLGTQRTDTVVFLPRADATYMLWVVGRETGVAGPYALDLLPSGMDGVAAALRGPRARGQLTPGDALLEGSFLLDVYRLEGEARSILDVGLDASFDGQLWLVDEVGRVLGDSDDTDVPERSRVAGVAMPAGGRVFVWVTGAYPGDGGAYDLTVYSPTGEARRGHAAYLPRLFGHSSPAGRPPLNQGPPSGEDRVSLTLRRVAGSQGAFDGNRSGPAGAQPLAKLPFVGADRCLGSTTAFTAKVKVCIGNRGAPLSSTVELSAPDGIVIDPSSMPVTVNPNSCTTVSPFSITSELAPSDVYGIVADVPGAGTDSEPMTVVEVSDVSTDAGDPYLGHDQGAIVEFTAAAEPAGAAFPAGQPVWSRAPAAAGDFVGPSTGTAVEWEQGDGFVSTALDDVVVTATCGASSEDEALTVTKTDLTIHKPPVIDNAEPAVPEADELTTGAQTFVNLDNDDQDTLYDTGTTDNAVAGEDEMTRLLLSLEPKDLNAGTVKLEPIAGAAAIKIWTAANKGAEYVLGTALNVPADFAVMGDQLVKELWVEGVAPHTVQRDTRLKLTYNRTPETTDSVALTILGLSTIDWVGMNNSINDDNALTADPNHRNPDGSALATTALRVFPDARVVAGALEAAARDRVQAAITLTVKPIEAVDVSFDSFDVDDPTANTAPIDSEAAAEDNRGTTPARSGAFTGEVGGVVTQSFDEVVETIAFRTTMQPGDNFRIVGNADTDFLADLRNVDSTVGASNDDKQRVWNAHVGGTLAQREIRDVAKYASRILTVWRFLHVEVDSMVAVPAPGNAQHNVVDRNLASITTAAGVAFQVFTSANIYAAQDTDADGVGDTTDNSAGLGRFENGSIRVGPAPGTTTNGLTGNTNTFAQRGAGIAIPFTVSNPPQADATGQVIALAGTTFTLNVTGGALVAAHNGGTITVAGVAMNITGVNVGASQVTVAALNNVPLRLHDDDDDTFLPRDPRTNFMQASNDPASNVYAPAYIRPRYDEGGTAGSDTHTVGFFLNTEDPAVYSWGSRANNADRFWVVYVLMAYQDSFQQMTADQDPDSEGGTGGSTAGVGGSLIYGETIRERGPTAGDGVNALEQRIVAHEVGHAMRLDHGDNTNSIPNNGLMNRSNQAGPTGAALRFIDRHLHELRSLNRPRS
jgi:hypothetical protein